MGVYIIMKDLYICKACWLIATPRVIKKGSHVLEKILWCFLILPGIIYSTWRHITKENVCPTCSSLAVFPINSIPGQKLFEEIHSNRNTRFVRRVLTYRQDDFMRARYPSREIHYHVGEH